MRLSPDENRTRPGSRAIFVHKATLKLFEQISPGLGYEVAAHGLVWPTKRTYWEASAGLTYPFNLLGNPSVVIPIGRDKRGLPMAVQVVGRIGEDRKLLNAAAYVATKIGAADNGATMGAQDG